MCDKNPFVSLIIPVYNATDSIKGLISDILKQTYNNFEVIFVDDGSVDNSYDLIKEYTNKCQNIYVYRKSNKGVSSARNFGMDKMNPKGYLMFADADDNITSDFIERMVYETLKREDTLVCCTFTNGKYKYSNYKDKFSPVLDEKMAGGYVWNKIFDKNIIIKNKLQFDTSIAICEDLLFCVEYLNYTKDVYVINEQLYIYNLNQDSVTNSGFNKNKMQGQLRALTKVVDIIPNSFDESKKTAYSGLLFNSIFYWVGLYNSGIYEKITREDKRKIMQLNKKSYFFSKIEFIYLILIVFSPRLLWVLLNIKNFVKRI